MTTTAPRTTVVRTVASTVYDVNKAVVSASIDTTKTVLHVVGDGVTSAVKTLRDSGATVVGQTRSAADRTVATATGNAREAIGQTRAQGTRASERLDDIADRTSRRVVHAVDDRPSTGTPYEDWTKAELYERAQDLEIEGRSTMSKTELIEALRAH